MLDKMKEIKKLKEENAFLKSEVERLKVKEEYFEGLISQCEQMKDDFRKSLFEARNAQAKYMTLYKELTKLVE